MSGFKGMVQGNISRINKELTPEQEHEIRTKVIKSKISLVAYYPFFATLFYHMDMHESYKTGTACTNGTWLKYNPCFMSELKNIGEINWVLVHETLHAALKHVWRRNNRDPKRWNIAVDYSVHNVMMEMKNALVDNEKTKVKERGIDKTSEMSMSLNMPEFCLYDPKYADLSPEEIYNILPEDLGEQEFDDHSEWEKEETQDNKEEKMNSWEENVVNSAEALRNSFHGNVPAFIERLIGKLTKPQKNWRELILEHCQTEVVDYSFTRPDKRFDEFDFFLPSFSDTDLIAKDILFFVDLSWSMQPAAVNKCFSEIQGAIDQFDGKLTGKIGFFDTEVHGLIDFEKVGGDVRKVIPKGGGGTSFHAPFEYVNENLDGDTVNVIIILTDGECNYPDVSITKGIPVVWIYTTKNNVPPFGKFAEINVDD